MFCTSLKLGVCAGIYVPRVSLRQDIRQQEWELQEDTYHAKNRLEPSDTSGRTSSRISPWTLSRVYSIVLDLHLTYTCHRVSMVLHRELTLSIGCFFPVGDKVCFFVYHAGVVFAHVDVGSDLDPSIKTRIIGGESGLCGHLLLYSHPLSTTAVGYRFDISYVFIDCGVGICRNTTLVDLLDPLGDLLL